MITPPFVDHCGIVLADCKHFLHILKQHRAAVTRLDNRVMAKRIEGFYRLKNHADH
jgi:hypothetical protein